MAAKFEREHRAGQILESEDLFGTTQALVGAGRSNAGRPKLAIRLMASLLYLKHSFDLSDEELVVRWSENVLWQARPSCCFCRSLRPRAPEGNPPDPLLDSPGPRPHRLEA